MCKFYVKRANWHYGVGVLAIFAIGVLFAQEVHFGWLVPLGGILTWNIFFAVTYSAMAEEWERTLPKIK